MSERPRVGVRELRQNLSIYLRRVVAGEVLEVTDRGQPVALVTPLPEHAGSIARLVAEGRGTAPRGTSPTSSRLFAYRPRGRGARRSTSFAKNASEWLVTSSTPDASALVTPDVGVARDGAAGLRVVAPR